MRQALEFLLKLSVDSHYFHHRTLCGRPMLSSCVSPSVRLSQLGSCTPIRPTLDSRKQRRRNVGPCLQMLVYTFADGRHTVTAAWMDGDRSTQ